MSRSILLLVLGVILLFAFLLGSYFAFIQIGGQEAKVWLDDLGVIQRTSYPQWTTIISIHCCFYPVYLLVAPLLGLAGLWGGIHGPG